MKHLFNNRVVKTVCTIVALLVLGIFIAAVNGHGETAQSTVVGTVFQPCHYVAQKSATGWTRLSALSAAMRNMKSRLTVLRSRSVICARSLSIMKI